LISCAFYFYFWLLSFPVIGEDGAANFVSMLDAIRNSRPFSLTFGVKFLEGMGQTNLFYSAGFDPFTWVMWLPIDHADAFRLSYVVRASSCWLFTFLLARALLGTEKPSNATAASAATLNTLLCYPLAVMLGVPNTAGIHHATQSALLPLLCLLQLKLSQQSKGITALDCGMTVAISVFCLTYPLNSLMGIGVFLCFGFWLALFAPRESGTFARRAFLKSWAMVLIVLFAPRVGLFWPWQEVMANSARFVFATELGSYGAPYSLPAFWGWVPEVVHQIIILAIAVPMVTRPLPWAVRAALMTLILVVCGSQLVTYLNSQGMLQDLLRPFPPAQRLDLYLPPFYALAAAYVLHNWQFLFGPAKPSWRTVLQWLMGGALLVAAVSVIWSAPVARRCARVLGVLLIVNLVRWYRRRRSSASETETSDDRKKNWTISLLPHAALAVFLFQTYLFWYRDFSTFFPHIGPEVICKEHRGPACADKPSAMVNSADIALTRFLSGKLRKDDEFNGRAEYLISPSAPNVERDDNMAISHMVRDMLANYKEIKSGMVLMSLPFQGVPVASSYEQSLDFLYYLYWTRYADRDHSTRPHINMTTLGMVHPASLALSGVRYVVARDLPYAPKPNLPKVYAQPGYEIFEVPNPNIKGYGPVEAIFGSSLHDEVEKIRQPSFNPARAVILPTSSKFSSRELTSLSPLAEGAIYFRDAEVFFAARSEGKRSLAVLPVRFSNCWKATFLKGEGTLLRANIALLALDFKDEINVRLSWNSGYGHSNHCLNADAELIPAAREAAAKIPYSPMAVSEH
jgi:hypothetical protein